MPQQQPYILHGRIVTMRSENDIIADGYIGIKAGRIAAVANKLTELPTEFTGKKIIHTEGTIYPGLIDLHNHFVYNVLPLWVVPKRYDNRSQWPAHAEYKSGVSKPIKQALAKYSVSAKALVRYVEAKALISGTTTGQGMRTQVKGGSKIFEGAMRNVEEPGKNSGLPEAGSLVPDLVTTGATAQERIDGFRNALNKPNRSAYFYHLSEGIDERSRKHFFNLRDNDLINNKLIGIHSLGLKKEDLLHLAGKGAKVVWSPFSNQLLYGRTVSLKDFKSSKIKFSLGCDWSPSGSKNMLQELKVAFHANKEQGDVFTTYELVRLATTAAAEVTGWQDHVGTLEKGKLADILVIGGKATDPYMHLVKALEKDVELVVVDGIPRYGNISVMKDLHFDTSFPLEEINISKKKKGIYLFCENSEINDVGFQSSMDTLEEIMKDLPGFVKKMEEEESILMDMGQDPTQEFTVVLDNEFEIEADVFQEYEIEDVAELLADPLMADSVEFDTPLVEGKPYWDRIIAQKNISNELKVWLKQCYNQ
ncbi:MAG: amidohydrolase family protein [Bacteroidota bacterium]|nr:amidohydrolase family protein [Bacteroidota bacterium]